MKYYRWGFNNQEYNDQFYISSGGFEKPHPLHSYGPMGRSGYMIHVVTGGHGIFVSNNKEYHLKKGDMFYIEPHKTTYMEADKDDPWTFYWIRFIGNLVPKYMKRINLSYKNAVMNQKELPKVFQDVIDIVEYSKNKGPRDFYYQAKVFAILQELEKHFPKNINNGNIPQINLYQKAVRYVLNNYEEQITVQDLVDYLKIDRSYVYRIFAEHSQKSPQEFITDYRLRKAGEMLKDANNSVEYVGLSCGFLSYQSFFRFFKQKYGISPSKYRIKYLD